jgi:hypothetical protein
MKQNYVLWNFFISHLHFTLGNSVMILALGIICHLLIDSDFVDKGNIKEKGKSEYIA